jgi:polygalacturonase
MHNEKLKGGLNKMEVKKKFLLTCALFGFVSISPVKTDADTIYTYPAYSGATSSPLYAIKANDQTVFTEKLTKYAGEMEVHYAHFSLEGTATIQVTVNESFSSYTLSPKSRKISATKSGNTITFKTGPNYLILKVDSKELLFILIDPPEVNPPKLTDSNVKNIMDYNVDNKGGKLETKNIQTAINEASGAAKNILYFPAGKYLTGEIFLKSNMTMYLEGGAILYGSDNTADFNSGSGGMNTEGMQHALIRFLNCKNSKLIGRGVLEGNGKLIRSKGLNTCVVKMDESSNILVDGVISRNSSYWNTLPYRSDSVTIRNYKVINCRPTTDYNNTDGVDFDECTNSSLYNALLYCGDDPMAVKNEFQTWNGKATMNTKNIHHEKIVTYSNSASCKIGTKTMGQSMTNVTFKDIDIIKAGRALVIDAIDNAVIENIKFEDIRIEATGVLIDIQNTSKPSWRTTANQCIVKNTSITNVASDANSTINLQGVSSQYNINGINFSNFTVQGKAVTSKTDSDARWNINSNVTNITFNTVATPSQDHYDQPSQSFNLFHTNSNISFSLPQNIKEMILLQIYDVQGRQISEYKIIPEKAGYHTVPLRSTNSGEVLSRGIYICKLKTNGFTKTVNVSVVR